MTRVPPSKEKKIIDTLANCSDFGNPEAYYKELLDLRGVLMEDPVHQLSSNIFTSLGNIERYVILLALLEKDRCVCELEAILQKTQGAVSHHLRVMEEAGLVRGWKRGKFTHYSIVRETLARLRDQLSSWLDRGDNWFGDTVMRR